MADESIQKPDSENSEEQGEARNDVVVKIGLVGDAQVISIQLYSWNIIAYTVLIPHYAGWKDHINGKVRRKQVR